MTASCHDRGGPVVLLPREVRLVVERILLLTRLPAGAVPSVRDAVLYSAAAGLGGLPLLQSSFETLRACDPAAIGLDEPAPGRLVLRGGGQHAWVVLPVLLDALAEAAERRGEATVEIAEVVDAEELRAAAALAPRWGLAVRAEAGALSAVPQPGAEDSVLHRALREGIPVEPALWWTLHHLSNASLSPDTPESRRHAGPVIVEADGQIIGRTDHDDDTDLSLLTATIPQRENA